MICHDSDRNDIKEGDQGTSYNATTQWEKVLYDDEPRNMKELIAHPERDELHKAGDAEIQQLIDQKFEVIVPKAEIFT